MHPELEGLALGGELSSRIRVQPLAQLVHQGAHAADDQPLSQLLHSVLIVKAAALAACSHDGRGKVRCCAWEHVEAVGGVGGESRA